MSKQNILCQQIILVVFGFLFLVCCKKTNSQLNLQPLPPAQGVPINVTIDPGHPSFTIASDYLGLSFEMTAITDSNYFNPGNTVFVQLIKNLGTGIFRIGANGVDKTFWTGKPRQALTPADSITTTDIDRFSRFIQDFQWKTIFGLNLGGNFNPATTADEASYVAKDLSGLLQSFEVGNEADLYPGNGYRNAAYTETNFDGEWKQYYNAVETMIPNTVFSGPAFAYNQAWLYEFSKQESNHINELTIHYYQAGPGTDPSINLNTLLAPMADSAMDKFGNDIYAIALGAQTPYRVAECNSIYGGGKTNVSNTFGASLWAIDFMWRLAYTGCSGINFHGGGNGPYSPIGDSAGIFFAKPEYYSMLFFKNGAKGILLPCKVNAGTENITAYASKTADGTMYVSILNKELQTDVAVTLQSGTSAHSVTLSSLTASNLNATGGLVLQGYTLNPDGTIMTGSLQSYSVGQSGMTINVPAASAMLVIIHP
jgi:Glycosyl hydrolase family 79, N-terminal domain